MTDSLSVVRSGVGARTRFAIVIGAAALAGMTRCDAQQIRTLTPVGQTSTDPLSVSQRLIQEGKFPQADAALRPLIAADPKAPEPHYLLAYALVRENKPKDALQEYTTAAALRAPNAADFREIALAYVLLEDYSDAEQWLNRSLALNGSDPETWYAMGRLHYTQGRYGDAVTCFQKALELNPRSVKSEDNLGLACEGLNRNDDAERAYRTAIDWQKSDAKRSEQPLLNFAILLLHRNQAAEAQQLLEQAVAIAPKDPRIHENLGQAYLKQEHAADAEREFAAAVTLAPENPRYHFLLGQAYHRSGDDAHAKQEFARSATLNGTHSNEH